MKVRRIIGVIAIGALTPGLAVSAVHAAELAPAEHNQAVAVAAWPVTEYNVGFGTGRTLGAVTWYNRSVHVQGNLRDFIGSSAWSQARFTFYIGERVHYQTTRTVSAGGTESYNFDVSATNVPGGITDIVVEYLNEWGVVDTEVLERP